MKKTNQEKTSTIISRISLEIPDEGINFQEFITLVGEQGVLLSCVVLTAPFLFPVSFPGSSIPFGLAIALLNFGVITKKHPLIPKQAMNYRISRKNILTILNGMSRILKGLEKFTKPRLSQLANKSVMNHLNSGIMIFFAFLLMLPLPVPLTDFLPAYSILFLSLGSIEGDGYMILVGYLLGILTTFYFGLIAILGIAGVKIILSFLGITF